MPTITLSEFDKQLKEFHRMARERDQRLRWDLGPPEKQSATVKRLIALADETLELTDERDELYMYVSVEDFKALCDAWSGNNRVFLPGMQPWLYCPRGKIKLKVE